MLPRSRVSTLLSPVLGTVMCRCYPRIQQVNILIYLQKNFTFDISLLIWWSLNLLSADQLHTIRGFWFALVMMRIDKYTFISSAVISFYFVSGNDFMFGVFVSAAKFVKNFEDRNKKETIQRLDIDRKTAIWDYRLFKILTSACFLACGQGYVFRIT